MATIPSDAFKARVASTKRLYEDAGQKGNDEYYEEEAVCDLVGELVGKSDILSNLKRNADYKVLGWMHSVAKSIMGVLRRRDNEYQKFSEAEKAFRQAYLDAVNREAGNATDTNGEQRKSVRKDVVKEMEDIIAKAKADGTYMKAPNGKPSNLAPTQWAMVRTKAFKKWFGDWEKAFKKNFLLNGKAVSSLNGDEFGKKEGVSLTDQVVSYYQTFGGKAFSPIFGDVVLDRDGVDDSLAHGMGRLKAVAYAAVKDVIEKGVLIDYDTNHKGRGYDSAVVAAPIEIDSKRYVCSVVVKRNKKGCRFYLHEVTEQKRLMNEGSNTGQNQPQHPKAFANILQKIVTDKENCSKVVNKNGEPLVVTHVTDSQFTVFDKGRLGENTDFNASDENWAKTSHIGFWFNDEITSEKTSQNHEMKLFLNIRNPYRTKSINSLAEDLDGITPEDFIEYMIDRGYDGVVVPDEEFGGTSFVALSNNQIKSATENEGTFGINNKDIRKSVRKDVVKEMEDVIAKANADGTYMKAPNEKPSNLSPTQWAMVRIKAFKKWFGDWEKAMRIEKLRRSKSVKITGKEIEPSEDLKQYKKNALAYGKTLRGEYTNKDIGETISLTGGNKRGGIREILQHDYKDVPHLQSIAAIPQIIENAVFIDELPNDDMVKYAGVKSFRYYVCGLKIGGENYTVKAVVAVQSNGTRYYDHKLSEIEKGELLSIIPTIQKAGIENNLPSSVHKDKRLISILQTNSSKVVDENGEPRVVYHGTPGGRFSVFGEQEGNSDAYTRNGMYFFTASPVVADGYSTKSHYKDDGTNDKDGHRDMTIDASEIEIHERRDRYSKNPDKVIGYEAYYNGEYIPDSDAKSREDAMKKAMKSVARNYYPADSRVFEAFMNLRNPYIVDAENGNWRNVQYPSKEELTNRGHDGVVIENVDDSAIAVRREISTDYIALEPTQIKSATENEGTFGINNKDIRKSVRKDIASETIDEVNRRFNERLMELLNNPKQKYRVLHLGMASKFLQKSGISNAEIILEYDKLVRKSKEDYKNNHPFSISDIKDLPLAIHHPIAVFDNTNGKDAGRVILTELKKDGRNFIVVVQAREQHRKGGVLLEINEISTLYPKEAKGILKWIIDGNFTNIDKEKALLFIEELQPHAGTTIKQEELDVATKIVKEFVNPKVNDEHFSVEEDNNNDTHTRKSIRQSAEEAVSAYKEEAEKPKPLVSAILHSIRGGKRNVPIDPFVEGWDSIISSDAFKLEETSFDSLKAVEEFQRYMTGSKDVPDYLNAHRALMVLSSVNKAQMDMFAGTYVENLRKAIEEMVGTAEMNKGFYAEDGALAELD